MSKIHSCYISNKKRNISCRLYRYVLNILNGSNETDSADEISVWLFINIGAACILVVFFERFEDVGDTNPHCTQTAGVNGYFVLLQVTAKAIHLRYSRGAV